ncbi:MAG: 3-keto-5-aminohexanoate cleavage protein, partial [Lachnospiraceae bacterium]|nr:3-keto-5-aminohexanoate cleavage protein [Lachnospiraceae bacterium]
PYALRHMLDFLSETFTQEALQKKEILWGYTQAHREDWEMMKYALSLGADSLRVGFEDSDVLMPGVKTERNAPIVQEAARLVRESGAAVMTSARAREILGIGA